MSKQTITSGEWYVKVETNNIFVYNDDQSRQHPIAVFYNDYDGLVLANHICDTHNAVPDMIDALGACIVAMQSYSSDQRGRAINQAATALRKAGQID